MNWFPLPIFPEGSLASSVVTTVWVGVVVFCVMNLRFGWVFSGLVVPGYLVPLIIVKPWAAAVILLETMLTLWTVLGVVLLMPKCRIACGFFGRDRFMAMILVSAVYRVVGDTWLLPMLGEYLTSVHQIDFDYRNNLHSFGLIVICLAANQLWKTGIIKGAIPFTFNILVTSLLVRYVLMEFTNFSISNLSFLYEDIAASIYAAPKAYIVLITTAILASRTNLLYGWDFNGIMIPALIALQWYEPAKVLTSFVEALVILGAGVLMLRLPMFKSVTVEGARKLLLFFTISFVYKMAIGWGLLFIAPEEKVSDFYGFGYLLPTLMAIKMHQMGKVIHQIRITAQISVVSVLVANAIGFTLTFLPSAGSPVALGVVMTESRQLDVSQLEALATRSFVDGHAAAGASSAPRPDEIYVFERGLDALARFASSDSDDAFDRAWRELAVAGFHVDRFGDRYLQIYPADPASGRPFFIMDLSTESDLAIECPRAHREPGAFGAALTLFRKQEARLLAVAGAAGSGGVSDFGDYGIARSWFSSIHRSFGRGGTIQVRRASGADPSRLYVKRGLPDGLNLQNIEDLFGTYTVLWAPPQERNALRDASRTAFCELFLSESALGHTLPPFSVSAWNEPIDSLVRREFYEFAPKATNLYQPPSAAELLHLDRHVFRPLFALVDDQPEARLARIQHHASYYGLTLTAYRAKGELYVVLKEPEPRRYWGGVLVRIGARPGEAASLAFEVPSRVPDRSLISFAATQFKRLGARALIVAGTNSLTNADGSSALTLMPNRDSFFNLAHQAFVRRAGSGAVVMQCRAFLPAPGERYPGGDLMIAGYHENRSQVEVRTALIPLISVLNSDGVKIVEVGEADDASPYAVGINPQAKYFDLVDGGAFALLWLSPFLRENYRFQDENDQLLKMIKAIGIPIRAVPLSTYVGGREFLPPSPVNGILKSGLRAFRERMDIHVLLGLREEFTDETFEAVIDPHSRQLYLACLELDGRPRLIANLSRHAFESDRSASETTPEAFGDSRAAWLEGESQQVR